MEQSFSADFLRYLAAKKTVDDRALNPGVFRVFLQGLADAGCRRMRFLELGAGVGTMIERLLDQGAVSNVEYTGLDADGTCLAEARRRLIRFSGRTGMEHDEGTGGSLEMRRAGVRLTFIPRVTDLAGFLQKSREYPLWDVLIAHAFLDLVDLDTVLDSLLSLLVPGGIFLFTITFDGTTEFRPIIDPVLDEEIVRLYHESMDRRLINGKPSGKSRTGRALLERLGHGPHRVLRWGRSDWEVKARNGKYESDEAWFLRFLVNNLYNELKGDPRLEYKPFREWVAERNRQIERGELVFRAGNIDVVGRTARERRNVTKNGGPLGSMV